MPEHEHRWDYHGFDLEAEVDHWKTHQDKVSEITISIAVHCIVDVCEATSRINAYSRKPEMDEIEEVYEG